MARGTDVPMQDLGNPVFYDPEFKGPLKNRSCTDIICLFLFIVFIGCWAGVAFYAYRNGDPEMLLIPKDSDGSRCGFDPHVKTKPFLYFFDLTKCIGPNIPFTGCKTKQVCVEKCPTDFFVKDMPNGSSNKANIICSYGIDPSKLSTEEINNKINEGECAPWTLPSNNILNRCIYNIADRRVINMDIGSKELDKIANMPTYLKSSDSWLSLTVHSLIEFFTDKDYPHKVGHEVVNDLKNSWIEILGGLAIGIVACILYIAVMRWIAPIMVWLSILGTLAILSFCTYICSKNYKYYKEHPYEYENAEDLLEKYLKKKELWLGLLIVVSIILGILLLVIIFLRKRIVLAIALIKEGSKAVSAVTSTLFFPIVPWILQMGVLVFAISLGLYLSSVGSPRYEIRNYDGQTKCTGDAIAYTADGVECVVDIFKKNCIFVSTTTCKFIKMDNPPSIPYLHVFNVFAFFWGVFFISALGEMILAATFATWYWTRNKSDVPFFTLTYASGQTLRYHIGTLAFGSLIIAICRMIRVALEYVDHKLKKYDNPVTKAVLCCLKCFFWCLEKFLKFINKNAYIMCAIHGKNFCSSAKDAFSLLLRNIVRVTVLDKVTDFLFFLSKLLVSIGVACIVYAFLMFVSTKEINHIAVPVAFVAVCTYLVASVFFSVYTMAVDTLFLCFLEDSERNDGSSNKPYFMSQNLMKILGKKNKLS